MKQGLGLGKGLGALIPKDLIKQDRAAQPALTDQSNDADAGGVRLIPIASIIANPVQPRRHFDEAALQELAQSIVLHGVITPVTVRKHFDGYELISGERRLRASQIAGLDTIPAYVIEVTSDAHMLELALIENVQREDLNPLETAQGYQRLIDDCGLTQEDVALRVGKDRSTVSNLLRLLKLPPDIQAAVRTRKIAMGHARALLALSTEASQLAVLREVIKRDLSVRKTEALVKDLELDRKRIGRNGVILPNESEKADRKRSQAPESTGTIKTTTVGSIEDSLRHLLGTQVHLKIKADNQGTIEIDFYSLEELERILELMAAIPSGEQQ